MVIMMSILLPSLQSARKKAYEASCKGNLKQLNSAIFMYLNDNDEFFMQGPDGSGQFRRLAVYCNAKNAAGNYSFDSGWNADSDLSNVATSRLAVCPQSGTRKTSLNYGLNTETMSEPAAYLASWTARIPKAGCLPAYRIVLVGDCVGDITPMYDLLNGSSAGLAYRHGGGDIYKEIITVAASKPRTGGDGFNAGWSDGSVSLCRNVIGSKTVY